MKENCVGCNLCSLVCPVEDCITVVRKDNGTEHNSWNDRIYNNDIPVTFNDDNPRGIGHFVPKPSDALKK